MIIKVLAVVVIANSPEDINDKIAVAKFAVKYLRADILGLIPRLVKLFRYLVIKPIYGPFIAYWMANNTTININDDLDN